MGNYRPSLLVPSPVIVRPLHRTLVIRLSRHVWSVFSPVRSPVPLVPPAFLSQSRPRVRFTLPPQPAFLRIPALRPSTAFPLSQVVPSESIQVTCCCHLARLQPSPHPVMPVYTNILAPGSCPRFHGVLSLRVPSTGPLAQPFVPLGSL